MMLGTPSRIRVLVLGSSLTSAVSGTCLIQTTIFIFSAPPYFNFMEPEITIFMTSEVPS